MQYLLPGAVFLLMISVGLGLKLTEVVANWRRMEWSGWLSLTVGTFIIPPALPFGVAPGAPLLTRNLARKGFDMHMAASYQVWAALMVPLMIPMLVAAAGKLYGRDIWVSPGALLKQIVLKQFLPLACGMMIAWIAPRTSQRIQVSANVVGNVLFAALLAMVLFKMGPALKGITPLVPVAALLLAAGSMAAILMLPSSNQQVKTTFAICKENRHVGLALLLI